MRINELPEIPQAPSDYDVMPIEYQGVDSVTYRVPIPTLASAIINKIGDPVGVAHGGSGLSSSPSLRVNLSSNSSADVMQASPRPGVAGTLGIFNGGTNATTAEDARTNLSVYSKDEVDQVLSDVYSKAQTDAIVAQAIASIIRTSETYSDFNDVTRTGFYSVFGSWENAPFASSTNGNMLVINGTGFVHQIVMLSNTTIFMRRRSGTTWNALKSITLT